jgi:hypothetical protein
LNTKLSNEIDNSSFDAKYDRYCKILLSDKMILAHILKSCVEEFKTFDVNYIANNCIGDTPQISNVSVHQNDKPEKVLSDNTEDTTMDEGVVYFDIRFVAVLPQTGENIRLIINIEAQNDYNPGYSIIKRGLYYCCRLISAQKETEFTHDNYDDIKKVYSIWICTNTPKYARNTINRYCITEKHIIGNMTAKPEKYDLINVIMVCLGEDSENTDGMNKNILKLLRVLLSGKVAPIKKKEILNNDFDIAMSVNTYKEMNSMCNLSQGIRREAELKGRLEGKLEGKLEGGISTLIETYQELGISVEQTLNKLIEKFGISEEEAKSKIEEYRK